MNTGCLPVAAGKHIGVGGVGQESGRERARVSVIDVVFRYNVNRDVGCSGIVNFVYEPS